MACMTTAAMLFAAGAFAALEPASSGNSAASPGYPTLDQKAALELSQSVVNQPVGDFTLLDRQGKPVRLADYRGKPLLVSFIYTGCFEVCPTTTRNLERAVDATVGVLGANRFNVVSVGFNQPFDSPQAMKSFAAQNGIDFPNWKFLSPAPAIVADLARSFGFSYVANPGGFDHIAQVTLVDAEGRIYRQIYGETLTPAMLVEPLKELVTGAPVAQTNAVADLLDRVRILCSVYDPNTGRYRFDYALVLEIAGMATFLLFLGYYFWRERRSRRIAAL